MEVRTHRKEEKMKYKFNPPCEFNPETESAAYEHEVHAEATWIVGHNGQWRVCEQCAKHPYFRRFRVKYPMSEGRKKGGEDDR